MLVKFFTVCGMPFVRFFIWRCYPSNVIIGAFFNSMMVFSQTCSLQVNCLALSLSLFEKASTPGQTQIGVGPKVYSFTNPGCCTARIGFCHAKPSEIVLHVVPDVWGTLLRRGLQFVEGRRTRNLVKEWDPI